MDFSTFPPECFLFSEQAMLVSKEFITSVVVGKDVVPRLGLHQMETLRHDLMATIKQSKKNKVQGHRGNINFVSIFIQCFSDLIFISYIFVLSMEKRQ